LWDAVNRIAGDLGVRRPSTSSGTGGHSATDSATHRPIRVFIQVNTSGEPNKSGVAPGALMDFLATLPPAPNIDLVGLMTMGPLEGGPEAARPGFRKLAALVKAARERFSDRHPLLSKLSMGMSGDFEIAVEEGAHYVRIGSALFGAR
jgi:uncharacterized pyridoxal phosphate-containing UPF0001 family protein